MHFQPSSRALRAIEGLQKAMEAAAKKPGEAGGIVKGRHRPTCRRSIRERGGDSGRGRWCLYVCTMTFE